MKRFFVISLALVVCGCASTTSEERESPGWPSWRGPLQSGVSLERSLVSQWPSDGKHDLWEVDLPGRGTPVVFKDRVYTMGYRGHGADLVEVLACLDAKDGALIWEHRFPDFLSDVIYDRYAIGSPTIDPNTGHVYVMTTNGVIAGFTQDGTPLWEHSMMEAFGRLTFPNGRTGSPLLVDDLVIFRGITANWGRQGPARDRFYAFDKHRGTPIWSSTPGVGPKDSSFSTPVLDWRDGQRVFYVGTGCGNVVCVNARTGEPIWRYPMAIGGVNASVVVAGNLLIAVHGKENLDSSKTGRMIALDISSRDLQIPRGKGTPVLSSSAELWRLDISSPTSSPVLYSDEIFLVDRTGELLHIDAITGKVHSRLKLDNDQLHASPLFADGKLYIPMRSGKFYVIEPDKSTPRILSERTLEGSCLGSPSVADGRFFVHTTERLYSFGKPGAETPARQRKERRSSGPPKSAVILQLHPNEFLLQEGDTLSFGGVLLDEKGDFVDRTRTIQWTPWIPSTAKVRSTLKGRFDTEGRLHALQTEQGSAGAFLGRSSGLEGTVRGRVVPRPPFRENFETFSLDASHLDMRFAYPPLSWIGARLKWIVRKIDGEVVLAKTLNRMLFQRSMVFIGHPDTRNYTMQADLKTDGDRRTRSTVGLVHQRYIIALKGNQQRLEVTSNPNRFREGVPFRFLPGLWYRLKTRVDVDDNGVGVIRAKAWLRTEPEPGQWTLEVKHATGHRKGAPGLFGFSPQNRFGVYIDNIEVTPND